MNFRIDFTGFHPKKVWNEIIVDDRHCMKKLKKAGAKTSVFKPFYLISLVIDGYLPVQL